MDGGVEAGVGRFVSIFCGMVTEEEGREEKVDGGLEGGVT